MNFEEVRVNLERQARDAAHDGEAVHVDVGNCHDGAAFSASVRFASPDQTEEYMSATGGSPEEASQNVAMRLGARVLVRREHNYHKFAKQVDKAIKEQFPAVDFPGNDGTTGVYLWKNNDCHAQMQDDRKNRVILHLWSNSKRHTVILNEYNEAARQRVVDAISKFLN